jgi:hypothetical protein
MLATLAYRGSKAIRNAPPGFGSFRAEGSLNTPVMLLAHIGDLIAWGHRWCQGDPGYQVSEPLAWEDEVKRFHETLKRFDQYLESDQPVHPPVEALFQAPIADALTHIGQLALLRRMAGDPVLGEAYRLAEIVPGRVGPEQAKPGREFERDKGAIWLGPKLP